MERIIEPSEDEACTICHTANVKLVYNRDSGNQRCWPCQHKHDAWLERELAAERRMRNLEFMRGA